MSSCAHVVHTTAKQVISRRRKNKNVYKMSKKWKCMCKACKNTVFHCQICKFVGFLLLSLSWLLSFLMSIRLQLILVIDKKTGETHVVWNWEYIATRGEQKKLDAIFRALFKFQVQYVAGVLKVSHDAFISSLASHLIFHLNLGCYLCECQWSQGPRFVFRLSRVCQSQL